MNTIEKPSDYLTQVISLAKERINDGDCKTSVLIELVQCSVNYALTSQAVQTAIGIIENEYFNQQCKMDAIDQALIKIKDILTELETELKNECK